MQDCLLKLNFLWERATKGNNHTSIQLWYSSVPSMSSSNDSISSNLSMNPVGSTNFTMKSRNWNQLVFLTQSSMHGPKLLRSWCHHNKRFLLNKIKTVLTMQVNSGIIIFKLTRVNVTFYVRIHLKKKLVSSWNFGSQNDPQIFLLLLRFLLVELFEAWRFL